MKKLLGTLLVVAFAPVWAVMEGCADKDECRYDYSSLAYFDVEGLAFAVIHRGQALAAGQSVAAAEISLAIQLQMRYYSQRPVPVPATWLPAAYACPPAPLAGHKGTSEVLDSLVVRCVFAYDAAHPAGAVVNDLLTDENGRALPPAPAPGTRPTGYQQELRLRQAPAQAGPQQFALRYRLTNGETYTARTPVFTLR